MPLTSLYTHAGKVIAMSPGVDNTRKAAEDIEAGKVENKLVVEMVVKL
jgi:hypothetical protein